VISGKPTEFFVPPAHALDGDFAIESRMPADGKRTREKSERRRKTVILASFRDETDLGAPYTPL
jgi:hypothetical protein